MANQVMAQQMTNETSLNIEDKPEVFTGLSGKYVPLSKTIEGFESILSGRLDQLPEQAFYLVGAIEEVEEKAQKLKD